MKCLNCGTENLNNFCSNCGQKNISKRLNFKELKDDFLDSILNYDNKFLKTIFAIFSNLKLLTNEYFLGKRKKYYHPIKLLFIILSIRTFTEIHSLKNIDDKYSILVNNGFWNFFLLLGLIPILSILSYLFFKKYKLNLIEHIIINSLVYCGVSLVIILLNTLNLVFEFKFNGIIALILGIISFSFLYSRVFNQNIILTILSSFIIYSIGFSVFLIFTRIVTIGI